MGTPHSPLGIPVWKRFYGKFAKFAGEYKYFLIIGTLAMIVPVVFGLAFAEGDEGGIILDDNETAGLLSQEHSVGGVDWGLDNAFYKEYYTGSSVNPYIMYGATALPTYYNSREEAFGASVTDKDQKTEGLCWANAAATTLEYSLLKTGTSSAVARNVMAPKHLDYQMLPSSTAYVAADVTAGLKNGAADRIKSILDVERVPGDGGSTFVLFAGLVNPLVQMGETDFATAIKANDSRLAGINTYEDIWSLGLDSTVLNANGAYDVKQRYAAMNDVSKTNYIVTDMEEIYYPIYGASSDKATVVETIKSAVKKYGAVEVLSAFDEDNCMSSGYRVDDDGDAVAIDGVYQFDYVVIERRTSEKNTQCADDSGHAMTIVGWDDGFKYDDNGTTKTGVFIIQNSWGDGFIDDLVVNNTATNQDVTIDVQQNYFMSYESAFDATYYTNIEPLSNYDNYYSANDYKTATLNENASEEIFEFTSNGKETLEKIVFVEAFQSSSYDIYVSDDGTSGNFVKAGTVSARLGINSFDVPNEVLVNGNFAIKLVRSNPFDEGSRAFNIATVYSKNYDEPEPEDPTKTFVATFDANGGSFTGGTTKTTSCTTTGTSCTVLVVTEAPTLSGSKFAGWADSETANETTYYAGGSLTLTADKTVYAVYAGGNVTWRQGQTHTVGSGEDLVVRVDLPLSAFKEVKVDGATVETSNYSTTSGSTILTLDSAFADSLSVGEHSLAIVFKTPLTITTTFTVENESGEEPEPVTPQSSNAYLEMIDVVYKIGGEEKHATLEPEFDKDTYDYEVVIPEGYDADAYGDDASVMVYGYVEDEAAEAEASSELLGDGVELMTIVVTAEDGSKKTYMVTIYYLSEVPEVPETGGGTDPVVPVTPSAPNTGFMMISKSSIKGAGIGLGFVVTVVVVVLIASACLIGFRGRRNGQMVYVTEA